MSETANPTKVGLFVVGAVAIALAAVVAFGSSTLFATTRKFEVNFDQSLMGLSVGAPVIFQGVRVGTVVEIYAVYSQEKPPVVRTPVIVQLVDGTVRRPEHMPGRRDIETVVTELVDTGMRAQLDVQSLVTGQLYVSLVTDPDSPITYRGDGELQEIPSIPSGLALVKETFMSVVRELRQMPLQEIGNDVSTIVGRLAELAAAPETQSGLEHLGEALNGFQELASSLDEKIDGAYDEYRKVASELQGLIQRADDALEGVVQLVEPGSQLQFQLDVTLQELRRTLESARALADQLQAQPDSILFGRGQKQDPP